MDERTVILMNTFKAGYDRCMEFLHGLVRDMKAGKIIENKIKAFWGDENNTWLILSSEYEKTRIKDINP